jgi:lipoprotein-releasing system ATP-binding protein
MRYSSINSKPTPVPVRAVNVSKVYKKGGQLLNVLDGADLELKAGEQVSIRGPSGCGKSTFLHMLGLLDLPSTGEIWLGEHKVTSAPESLLHRLRNFRVGFVFQSHNLLAGHSALGNVMMPVRLAGGSARVAEARARALLAAVGLSDRLTHRPGELSGGEQQRVAVARALVMGPGLILADEPTGNLDPKTAVGVFELLMRLNADLGSTLVVVTHSQELALRFGRRLRLQEGRFEEY